MKEKACVSQDPQPPPPQPPHPRCWALVKVASAGSSGGSSPYTLHFSSPHAARRLHTRPQTEKVKPQPLPCLLCPYSSNFSLGKTLSSDSWSH